MPQEKSAGAIIFRMVGKEPYYLLLHYPSGHWEFAKGHIEENEEPEAAALRETKEETGIDQLTIIPGFKEHIKYFFKNSYNLEGEAKKTAPWVFKLVTFYLAETKTQEVNISGEHTEFSWLPYQEALERLTYKNAKDLLKKAHQYLLDNRY